MSKTAGSAADAIAETAENAGEAYDPTKEAVEKNVEEIKKDNDG